MTQKPVVVIAGGSGFFGNHLIEYFKESKQIIVLTRGISQTLHGIVYQNWDGKTIGEWVEVLNNAEVLINLSGKSINCRFTKANKKELIHSRVSTTKILSAAIRQLDYPPKIWINASAGALYLLSDQPNTEEDKALNKGFLSEMVKIWEDTFFKYHLSNTKRAALRISLIFGKDGGVFPVLRKITSLFLGGKAGSGNQIVSWIHIEDAVRAVEYVMENKIEGAINFSTYQPISNANLMRKIRKSLKIPFGFPAPSFGIKLGSFFMNTEPSLLLDSVNYIPQKLLDEGFKFNYSEIDNAIENLIND